jgi:hypothetical protein
MKKWPILTALLVGLGVLLYFVVFPHVPRSELRKRWKDQALSEISAQIRNPSDILKEKAEMESEPDHVKSWLSDHLILMHNGEWLVYRSICYKEHRNVDDAFLAYGSDGKWYYSTYHFCVGMVSIMPDPHQSLAGFAYDYALEPFDGKSDVCLQVTWPNDRERTYQTSEGVILDPVDLQK